MGKISEMTPQQVREFMYREKPAETEALTNRLLNLMSTRGKLKSTELEALLLDNNCVLSEDVIHSYEKILQSRMSYEDADSIMLQLNSGILSCMYSHNYEPANSVELPDGNALPDSESLNIRVSADRDYDVEREAASGNSIALRELDALKHRSEAAYDNFDREVQYATMLARNADADKKLMGLLVDIEGKDLASKLVGLRKMLDDFVNGVNDDALLAGATGIFVARYFMKMYLGYGTAIRWAILIVAALIRSALIRRAARIAMFTYNNTMWSRSRVEYVETKEIPRDNYYRNGRMFRSTIPNRGYLTWENNLPGDPNWNIIDGQTSNGNQFVGIEMNQNQIRKSVVKQGYKSMGVFAAIEIGGIMFDAVMDNLVLPSKDEGYEILASEIDTLRLFNVISDQDAIAYRRMCADRVTKMWGDFWRPSSNGDDPTPLKAGLDILLRYVGEHGGF